MICSGSSPAAMRACTMSSTSFSRRSATALPARAALQIPLLGPHPVVHLTVHPATAPPYLRRGASNAHGRIETQAIAAHDEPAPAHRAVVKVKKRCWMRKAALPSGHPQQFRLLFGQRRGLDAQVAPLEHGLAPAVEKPLQARDAHLGLYNRAGRIEDEILAVKRDRLAATESRRRIVITLSSIGHREVLADARRRLDRPHRQKPHRRVLGAEQRLPAPAGQRWPCPDRAASRTCRGRGWR